MSTADDANAMPAQGASTPSGGERGNESGGHGGGRGHGRNAVGYGGRGNSSGRSTTVTSTDSITFGGDNEDVCVVLGL